MPTVCLQFFDENIAPADRAAVRLQLDRAFFEDRVFAIKVVFHDSGIHDLFSVEVDGHLAAYHDDTHAVPLPEGFVHFLGRILTGCALAVVPEPAGSLIGTMFPLASFFGGVPDLNLGHTAEVNTAIGLGHGLVFKHELEVAVIFVGCQIESVAVVDELTIFNAPVFVDVFTRFFFL